MAKLQCKFCGRTREIDFFNTVNSERKRQSRAAVMGATRPWLISGVVSGTCDFSRVHLKRD